MSNNKKAFPNSTWETSDELIVQYGMDLRDYFAAKALQGLLSNPKLADQILKGGGATGGWVEQSAYGWADAMMKVRDE